MIYLFFTFIVIFTCSFWEFWGNRELTPEEEEAEALRELANLKNSFDAKAHLDALARLRVAREKIKAKQLREAGYDTANEEIDKALVEMARYQSDYSRKGREKFLEASKKLFAHSKHLPPEIFDSSQGQNSVKKDVQDKNNTQSVKKLPCVFCQGAGWLICSGCHGTGRNNYLPPPQYTGNPQVDALISFNHQQNALCRNCLGHPQIHCQNCNGTGFN